MRPITLAALLCVLTGVAAPTNLEAEEEDRADLRARALPVGWSEIRKVAAGAEPQNAGSEADGPITTYCHNTVLKVPPADSREAERALWLAFGREITRRILAGEIAKDRPGAATTEALRSFRFPEP